MSKLKTRLIGFFTCASCAMFWGCDGETSKQTSLLAITAEDARYSARFSDEDLNALERGSYKAMAYGNGSTTQVPQAFEDEFGEFTVGAELKAYIPISVPREIAKSALIKSFEKVSDYTKITDVNGAKVYQSAVSVDSEGYEVPERVEGQAPREGKNTYAKVVVLNDGKQMRTIMLNQIADDSGLIRITSLNHTDLTTRVIFEVTAVRAGDSLCKLELYPYKNGYLVYAGGKAIAANAVVASFMNAESVMRGLMTSLKTLRAAVVAR